MVRRLLVVAVAAWSALAPTSSRAQVRPPVGQGAPPPASPTMGRLRGVIYDSLAMRPLQGATVFVTGLPRIAVTDGGGAFEIDSIPAGRRNIAFSTPAIDSLGLFTLGNDVTITAGDVTEVQFFTPSFNALWRGLCPTARATRGDSGIVFGAITNAADQSRIRGARVVLTWFDLNRLRPTLGLDRAVLVARSDTTGAYVACGVPTEISLEVDVDAAPMSSGVTETVVPATRITRRDLSVSADMYVPDSVRRMAPKTTADGETSGGPRRRGTSTLRGVVRDPRGQPIANALVTIPSADTSVRTTADGTFTAANMPAGSQLVRVRSVGFEQLSRPVELKRGAATELTLELSAATTLAAVSVRADRRARFLQEFDERRTKIGGGSYLGRAELATKNDLGSALSGFPALRVQRNGGRVSLLIERGASACTPNIYIDGIRSTIEEAMFYRPEDIYGVEVYSRAESVPSQWRNIDNNCGSILVWSTRMRS